MKKLVISLMIVALAVSAQAGTLSIADDISDLDLTSVVAAVNAGGHGSSLGNSTTESATTVMEGITWENDGVGKGQWDGHNDDNYSYGTDPLVYGGEVKAVGPGGSAAPSWARYDTMQHLLDSETYGNAPGTISKSLALGNGEYTVQVLFQARGNYMTYSAMEQLISIEGVDSDLYDVVAMNASNSLIEDIDGSVGYVLGAWLYTDTVTVTDGVLDISAVSIDGNVKWNAIVVNGVPEPASMVLLGLGGLLLRRRKK